MTSAPARLTPAQQGLVLDELGRDWLRSELSRGAPAWLRAACGRDDLAAEAWYAVARAARTWVPATGPFGGYARVAVRNRLRQLRRDAYRRSAVWREMPRAGWRSDGSPAAPLADALADHRRPGADPLAAAWASDEFRAARRRLDLKTRVLVALRVLHGLTLEAAGALLGTSRQRVHQLLALAGRKAVAGRGR